MKVVQVASEFYPYAKTGGLADAVGALARSLAAAGHRTDVFLPGYRCVLEHPDFAKARETLLIQVELGAEAVRGRIHTLELTPNLTLHVVRRDEYFDRGHLYGLGAHDYDDNDRRFIFFCKAVIEYLRVTDLKADIFHAHDWQAGLAPLFLRFEESRTGQSLALKTVFTIHNLAFQGIFSGVSFGLTNLPAEFMRIAGLEYHGQMSMMKGGIVFSDHLTTVSPTYAKEILTPYFGCGLDGVIRTRERDFTGLLNGVDTEVWNPENDPHLPKCYSYGDLTGKAACRKALLKEFGLDPASGSPVYGMVCRLTAQKGLDLLLAQSDFFRQGDRRLVILGRGEEKYERALERLARHHPGKIGLRLALDERIGHLIEAGSDFFLMPSIFEPCGLNQMYSQIYGTPPLASRVGGLVDTIIDLTENPDEGTGFLFEPEPKAFLAALEASAKLFADDDSMTAVRKCAMRRDFSWKQAAKAYEALFHDLV
ncbi:MAG: glycogen synthase GlgA [Puniceicoccaceae bacterium]|nr:MAG: glycogen synthase GlgA [Puniceicoccaceae bacterium]